MCSSARVCMIDDGGRFVYTVLVFVGVEMVLVVAEAGAVEGVEAAAGWTSSLERSCELTLVKTAARQACAGAQPVRVNKTLLWRYMLYPTLYDRCVWYTQPRLGTHL